MFVSYSYNTLYNLTFTHTDSTVYFSKHISEQHIRFSIVKSLVIKWPSYLDSNGTMAKVNRTEGGQTHSQGSALTWDESE